MFLFDINLFLIPKLQTCPDFSESNELPRHFHSFLSFVLIFLVNKITFLKPTKINTVLIKKKLTAVKKESLFMLKTGLCLR